MGESNKQLLKRCMKATKHKNCTHKHFKSQLEKEVKEVEEKIISWSKLIAECNPGSTRFEVRVNNIDKLIQVRRGLKYMLKWIEED